MSALVTELSGLKLISAEAGLIHLQLTVSLPEPLSCGPSTLSYTLKAAVDPQTTSVGPVELDPNDIEFEDILKIPHPQKLAFVVSQQNSKAMTFVPRACKNA